MFRILQVNDSKPIPATAQATTELKTGMGVVYNIADNYVELPTAATASNIFFVDKERIASGLKSSLVNLSDYDEDFNTVVKEERCQRHKGYPGDRFAVDQFGDLNSLNTGEVLSVGTDGKWIKATSESKYMFGGTYDDAGHQLGIIEVLSEAVENE